MSDWEKAGEGKCEVWKEKPKEPMGCATLIGGAFIWLFIILCFKEGCNEARREPTEVRCEQRDD